MNKIFKKEIINSEDLSSQRISCTKLLFEKSSEQHPIVYRDDYNIKLLGMEKLHPFDAGKWGNVVQHLKRTNHLSNDTIVTPKEASSDDLKVVHTARYLKSLKWSAKVAQITEVPPVALLPNFVVQKKILRPFRFQTGGSILGGKLAVDYGWSINIGGGFHHCSGDRGSGFCAYADITLAIKFTIETFASVNKVMIIDLDAHQGNGHERDFLGDESIYIFDVYNCRIFPKDEFAKKAIRRKVELEAFTKDNHYLSLVKHHVEKALDEFAPDFVVFNAGTDILEGDSLGLLSVSSTGVIRRDEIIWQEVRSREIPLLMLTSGGYQRSTAKVIADSIRNLNEKKLINIKM